jgi:hypothetical protein
MVTGAICAVGSYEWIFLSLYSFILGYTLDGAKKIKFILEHATKAQRGSRGIALLFL